MRIYIIANDGITLCRDAPATVSDGEIVVASNEELHAARLSGKQLLALWNASTPANPPRRGSSRNSIRCKRSAKPARRSSIANGTKAGCAYALVMTTVGSPGASCAFNG